MSDQEMRAKVIKGLELCGYCELIERCNICPYEGRLCFQRLKEDALTILKQVDPRVMTLEEAYEADVCWLEGRDVGRIIPCRLYKQAGSITVTVRKLIASPEDLFIDDYGIEWRCWSLRPTDALREAVKWDG